MIQAIFYTEWPSLSTSYRDPQVVFGWVLGFENDAEVVYLKIMQVSIQKVPVVKSLLVSGLLRARFHGRLELDGTIGQNCGQIEKAHAFFPC